MPRYSCFLLDASGAIRGAEIITAKSDADAWHKAIELLEARPAFSNIEVWERSHRIDLEQHGTAPNGDGSVERDSLPETAFRRLHRPVDVGRRIPAEQGGAAGAGLGLTLDRTHEDRTERGELRNAKPR